jgi:hypothetical protein
MPAQSALFGLSECQDAVLATQKLVEHATSRRRDPSNGSNSSDLCALRSGERNKTHTNRYGSRAGSRCSSPGSAVAAVSRTVTVALFDSGVGSGLTSMTAVPLANANSGSPAAG